MLQTDAEVIFCTLPILKRRILYGWRALVLGIALVIFAFTFRAPAARITALTLAGLAILGFLFWTIGRGWHKARPQSAPWSRDPSQHSVAASFGWIVRDLEHNSPANLVREATWSWPMLDERRRQAELPRPRALAASCLEPAISAIETPADLLEPEPIVSSVPMAMPAVVFTVCLYGLFATNNLLDGRVWLGALFLVLAVALLVQVPQVRDRVPVLRRDEVAPIAGVGYVETPRGARWTTGDSMLLVWAQKAPGPLFVRLVGPAGWQSWTFTSASDAEFLRLWQRWMHPHPRPELAG